MRSLGVLLAVAVVLGIALPAMAFVIQTGDAIISSENLRDDLYAAGQTVVVNGAVDGDVAAAGRMVTIEGKISGVVLAAGRDVRVGGRVGRTVRLAGQTVSIVGMVGSDVVAAAADVTVLEQARIDRDLLAVGKAITVAGDVRRYARLTGDTVVVAGRIGQGLRADARSVTILPSAVIDGDVRYSAETPIDIRPGAQIKGKVERVAHPTRPEFRVLGLPAAFVFRLWEAVGLLLIGLVVVSLAPQGAREVASNALRRFPISLLAGVGLLVLVPVAAVVLTLTVIGIPLAAVAMLLLAATVYPAQTFVATGIGQMLLTLIRRGRGASIRTAVAIGTLILVVLFAIPYGWIVRLVVMLLGVGGLLVTVWRWMEEKKEALALRVGSPSP